MHYEGHHNVKCSVCKTSMGVGWHPLIVRISGVVRNDRSRRICPRCFQEYYQAYSKLTKEADLEQYEAWLEQKLSGTDFKSPADYTLKGFWFGLFDNGPLGLIINYEKG
jgi:hypothetical protein